MPQSKTPAIEPDKQYRVKMARVVKSGGVILRPRDEVILKGRVLDKVKADVASFEEA